jgi:hypothetical protein
MDEPGLRTVEAAQTSAPCSCGEARHSWAVNSAKHSGNGPTKPAPMRTNVATNADVSTGGLPCSRRASIYQAMSQTMTATGVLPLKGPTGSETCSTFFPWGASAANVVHTPHAAPPIPTATRAARAFPTCSTAVMARLLYSIGATLVINAPNSPAVAAATNASVQHTINTVRIRVSLAHSSP